MATETAASVSNNRTSQNSPLEDNRMRLRDASFSSYLARDEDNFIATPTSAVIATIEPLHQLSFGRKNQQDGEISIFSAEKYFEGGRTDEGTVSSNRGMKAEKQKVGKSDQLRAKALKQSPAPPSFCPEVMSGNSQTALLQKDPTTNWQKQSASRRIFSSFACNPCSRRKSVNVNEQATESRNSTHLKSSKAVDFQQPLCQEIATNDILVCRNPANHATSQLPKNMTLRRQFEAEEKAGIPPSPPSLAVFGFRFLGKDSSHSPLRSLTMLTADAGRKLNEEIAECSVGQSGRVEEVDDLGSDSSSDLFEIESLTSKAYPISSRRRSDDLSSCAASTEQSSMAESDHHDRWKQRQNAESQTRFAAAATTATCKSSTTKISMVKEAQQRRRQNSFLGCKGSNSVEVLAAVAGADAYYNGRFQSDFESMHAQRVLATSTSSALFIHG